MEKAAIIIILFPRRTDNFWPKHSLCPSIEKFLGTFQSKDDTTTTVSEIWWLWNLFAKFDCSRRHSSCRLLSSGGSLDHGTRKYVAVENDRILSNRLYQTDHAQTTHSKVDSSRDKKLVSGLFQHGASSLERGWWKKCCCRGDSATTDSSYG